MFTVRWTEEGRATYEQLLVAAERALATRRRSGKTKSSRQEDTFKQAQKTIDLLAANPRHPSLQTHEYDGVEHPYDPHEKVWEAYAQHKTPGAYRVFWCYGPDKK